MVIIEVLYICLVNGINDLKCEVLFHYLFVFVASALYSLEPECTEIVNERGWEFFGFLFT